MKGDARMDETEEKASITPEVAEKVVEMRNRLHTSVGQVVIALSQTPRYRHMPLKDLGDLVFEPLLRDRIAVATPNPDTAAPIAKDAMAGVAVWATVSEQVEAKIREQIRAGVFPLRLAPGDWVSGEQVWLLDVIAPDKKTATAVLRNFAAFVRKGPMKLHPVVRKVVDIDELRKMGATEVAGSEVPAAAPGSTQEAEPE